MCFPYLNSRYRPYVNRFSVAEDFGEMQRSMQPLANVKAVTLANEVNGCLCESGGPIIGKWKMENALAEFDQCCHCDGRGLHAKHGVSQVRSCRTGGNG